MTQAGFSAYSAVIIGDPSTASCAATVPSDALSTAGTWGPAVTGNVAVLGTAPALAGSPGTALMTDAIAYAASGGSGSTGLYASLNCEYSSASAGTSVPLLDDVDGGGFTATGQGVNCPADAGSVNTWDAVALPPFNGLSSANLGPWSSPACSVQETLNTWPGALGAVGYLPGASPATLTASDGATGQAYILAGAPQSAAAAALSPSVGGQVPPGSAVGGSNAAAPGVSQSVLDGVDTAAGDFSLSSTDLSIPTFGPGLDFTRTYDAALAQRETTAGSPLPPGEPGSMGYGWASTWDTSLSASRPVPGDVYTVDGLATDNGISGPPASQPLQGPGTVVVSGGSTYIADSAQNRVLEVAGSTGGGMTAGDMYVIAGSPVGLAGSSPNGTPALSSLLDDPQGLAVDGLGNLYIADTGNNRVLEIPGTAGQNRGFGTMTVNDVYTIAGHGTGASGHGGDGAAANSAFLDQPYAVSTGHGNSDIYIADTENSRIQEVPAESGTQWGQAMTAWDIYTVTGDPAGTAGDTGDGGPAGSALLNGPAGITFGSGGDLYIADSGNNRIQELAATSGAQWGITPAFTAGDIYTIAGSASGAAGHSANGTTATSALLSDPTGVAAFNGMQLYVTDQGDSRIEEAARTSHAEWGLTMTADDLYTIAGTGVAGFDGDGHLATSARLKDPASVWLDPSFNMYIADWGNNRIREISASTGNISEYAGDGGAIRDDGDGGPALAAGVSGASGVTADPQGDVLFADTDNNRVQEIAASTHTQFGIAMNAGDVYTVAGDANGAAGLSGDGGAASDALLFEPDEIAIDAAGNLYIADSGNNRVQKVSASTGTISTIAGSAVGAPGSSGDGGSATAALLNLPAGVDVDAAGDVFIADTDNNRVQEVPAATGHGMTGGDIYTIAGSASGTSGSSGDGGAASSALLLNPYGVTADATGDLYIADAGNERVQEIFAPGGTTWGQHMTAGAIYTVAGVTALPGSSGDSSPATQARLNFPTQVTFGSSGDMYIADNENNRVQEVAAGAGAQWGQQMTAGNMYTVAGSPAGTFGESGDGGPGRSALFEGTISVAVDTAGNLFIPDLAGGSIRELIATASAPLSVSPAAAGVTVNEPGSAQVTFYPKSSGLCSGPYVSAGSTGFCVLPQDIDATLTVSGLTGNYQFSPATGAGTFTYNSSGELLSESDAAGDSLTVTYASPAPGTGNCPATASWCQTVTSASGRALTIGYNAAGLTTSVTDPRGREWTYGYTGSDLTSATDPMGSKTTYSYGAGPTGNPRSPMTC